MAERKFLSNDSTASGGGIEYDESVFPFNAASESSVFANDVLTLIPLTIAKANGRIVDVVVGVVLPPLSAGSAAAGAAGKGFYGYVRVRYDAR